MTCDEIHSYIQLLDQFSICNMNLYLTLIQEHAILKRYNFRYQHIYIYAYILERNHITPDLHAYIAKLNIEAQEPITI